MVRKAKRMGRPDLDGRQIARPVMRVCQRREEAKSFVYDSCGETISFAESLGWEEADNWPEGDLDEFEHDALEYIKSKGYVITEQGENK